MNKICIVTFLYPGVIRKSKKFFLSLNRQTNQNFDVIIFLNNQKKINIDIQKYKIKIIKLNLKIISSRFEMIRYLKTTSYDNIVFQDADDTMSINRIEEVNKELSKNHVVVNDLDIILNKKKIKNYLSKRIKNKAVLSAKDIINYNFMGMSNTAIRKKCLNKVTIPKRYKIKIFDWYFWTIILSKYKARFINSTSTQYFISPDSPTCLPTSRKLKILQKIDSIIDVHKKTIAKLIKDKFIRNIKIIKISKKVNYHKKNNFWWEISSERN